MDWSHMLPDSYGPKEVVQSPHSDVEHELSPTTSPVAPHPITIAGPFPGLEPQHSEHSFVLQHGASTSVGRQTGPLFDFHPNVPSGLTSSPGLVIEQQEEYFTSLHDNSRTLGGVSQANEWEHGFATPFEHYSSHSLDENMLHQPLQEPRGPHKHPTTPQQATDSEISPVFTLSPQQSHPMQLIDYDICAIKPTANPKVFVFRCTDLFCYDRTFTRWPDFLRHYNGAHAAEKTLFWCPISCCDRSEGENNRPFPRKDRMMDHALKIHGIEGKLRPSM